LPEEACDSLYEHPIKIGTDFLESAGSQGHYLSRKVKEEGESTKTALTKEIFDEIWAQVGPNDSFIWTTICAHATVLNVG